VAGVARSEIETQVVLNPSIAKDSPKVVDTVEVSGLEKPVTAYCRQVRRESNPSLLFFPLFFGFVLGAISKFLFSSALEIEKRIQNLFLFFLFLG
jgi:hypothetical protein